MRERGGTGKTVSFRVNKEFYERFKAIARALGYSPTEAIREAMRRFVKEYEKEVVKT
jgi:predicted DNA-binding protein